MRKACTAFLIVATFLTALCSRAAAEITPDTLSQISAAPPDGAKMPLNLMFNDESGRPISISAATAGTPVVLIFADYTCSTLCGPIVSLVSNDLMNSGLRVGEDYRLVVVGLDPKDKIEDARAMKKAQLASGLQSAAFLTGSEESIRAATTALGYHYRYDPAHDQFAHSAAIYILNADGQVSRVLNGLSANARDLRLALVAASQGAVGTFSDHVQLICYGFDPAKGTYSLAVSRVLFAACCSTVLGLAAIIGFLFLGGSTRKA